MPSNSRIAWIDEFKGLVLLLVCICHVDQHFLQVDLWSDQLVCLRMAAFYFISGVLFSNRRFPNFKDYFLHKSKVLLLPYVTLSFLFLILNPVVYDFDLYANAQKIRLFYEPVAINGTLDYIALNLENIFVEGKSSSFSAPLWFVYNLYFVSLFFYLFQTIAGKISTRFCHDSKVVKNVVVGVVALVCLMAGYTMSIGKVHLPFGIERICSTLFYFAIGFLCKELLKKLESLVTSKYKFVLVLASISFFALYALLKDPSPWRGLYNNNISMELVVSSFFGIAGLIAILSLVSSFNIRGMQVIFGVLRNVSRNGLIVLAVHYWILMILKTLLKTELDKPFVAYLVFPLVAVVVVLAIPLFRSKLYWLIGKEKVSAKESLSIK